LIDQLNTIARANYPLVAEAVELKTRSIKGVRFEWAVLLLQCVILFLLALIIMLPALLFIPPPTDFWIALNGNELIASIIDFNFNMIASFGAIFLAIVLFVTLYERRSLRALGFRANNKIVRFFVGFGLGLGSMALVAMLLLLVGDASVDNSLLAVSGLVAIPFVLALLPGWIVQASTEELLMQGWFLPKAAKTYGVPIGIFMTAVLFALLHGFNPGNGVLPTLNLLLYGTLAALYALHESGIMGIAGYHIAWNWGQGNIFGLSVSGGEAVRASLVKLTYNSDNVFNGSSFGPEGGLIVTGLLMVTIVTLLWLLYRRTGVDHQSGIVNHDA
jgi:uncharacterized protein